MYIPEAAVDSTLLFVAGDASPGSIIVFDYFLESALRSPPADLKNTAGRVATVGEPFVFGMPGQDATAFVKQRGLAVASDVGYGELGLRYLSKGLNLPVQSVNRICTAVVP